MGAPVVKPHYSFGDGGTYGGKPCVLGETFEDQGQRVKCKAADEFADLTGKKSGEPGASLGHLRLWTFDIATITSDLEDLDRNFTYGDHYRLSVYEDCKPCPVEYACKYSVDPDPELGYDCSLPADQLVTYERCLNERFIWTCVNGSYPYNTVAEQGIDCERYTTPNATERLYDYTEEGHERADLDPLRLAGDRPRLRDLDPATYGFEPGDADRPLRLASAPGSAVAGCVEINQRVGCTPTRRLRTNAP